MGGSAFAKGSAKQVKTAESKNTAESAKQSKHKNTAESAQSSKPQQPANSEKDTKNSKSNVESTGKAKYSAATGNLNKSNSHAESSTNQTVLKAASGNSSATAAKPVYDTADNYTKVSEDDGSITYNYVKNPKKLLIRSLNLFLIKKLKLSLRKGKLVLLKGFSFPMSLKIIQVLLQRK